MHTCSIRIGRGSGALVGALLSAMVGLGFAVPVAAQVTVDGGRSANNPVMYEWTVTNGNDGRIVAFWIPRHSPAENFEPPDGWECAVADKVKPGTKPTVRALEFRASSPRAAIRSGRSNIFKLLVTMDKATPRSGYAVVEFDDGAVQLIADVEIPGGSSWLRRRALAIGFGTMFAVFLLVQVIRGRRKSASDKPAAPEVP